MSDSISKFEEMDEARSYSGLGIDFTQDDTSGNKIQEQWYLVEEFDKDYETVDKFISKNNKWNRTYTSHFEVKKIEIK